VRTGDEHIQHQSAAASGGRIEGRLRELGIVLSRPLKPLGTFAYGVEHAGVLYLSGTHGTRADQGVRMAAGRGAGQARP